MARSQTTDSSAPDDAPNSPTDLSGGSWLAAARRALKEYKADDLQDRAAALTYFGIQSIFPGLLVLVSLLGILGKPATQPLITNLGKALSPSSYGWLHLLCSPSTSPTSATTTRSMAASPASSSS